MSVFSPITSNKLYIQIYNQIYEAITSGKFKVGDKLPSEKELCQMFNVSRVPVREALCALELNGVVDSIQGVGVYVKSSLALGADLLNSFEPQDIIRARMCLEPYIAYDAALHITEEGKVGLRKIVERFREESQADDYTIETDNAFHLCIAKASGNSIFDMIMEMIMQAMIDHKMWQLQLSRTIATAKYREQNYVEHTYIAEAILDGNAQEAYERMKVHMENLPKRYWE